MTKNTSTGISGLSESSALVHIITYKMGPGDQVPEERWRPEISGGGIFVGCGKEVPGKYQPPLAIFNSRRFPG